MPTKCAAIVGELKQELIQRIGANVPAGPVYMFPGAEKHAIKRDHHAIYLTYKDRICEILENPDYVGVHPGEKSSIELVKCFDDNVLVAIKLAPEGYLYYSSMYDIPPSKVAKRLASGRWMPV